jgi:hypothetical protein
VPCEVVCGVVCGVREFHIKIKLPLLHTHKYSLKIRLIVKGRNRIESYTPGYIQQLVLVASGLLGDA